MKKINESVINDGLALVPSLHRIWETLIAKIPQWRKAWSKKNVENSSELVNLFVYLFGFAFSLRNLITIRFDTVLWWGLIRDVFWKINILRISQSHGIQKTHRSNKNRLLFSLYTNHLQLHDFSDFITLFSSAFGDIIPIALEHILFSNSWFETN